MRFISISSFVLCACIVSSCSLLITQKLFLGVRNPKNKTEAEIRKFIRKNDGIDSTITLNKAGYLAKVTRSSAYLSTWELYDKNGFLLIPIDSNINFCNSYTQAFIKNIHPTNYLTDSTTNIYNDSILTSSLTNLSGKNKLSFSLDTTAQYHLLIYWSTFMGKYSSDLFKLEKLASNNRSATFSTTKINMDLKDFYNMKRDDLNIKLRVNKQ